MSAVALWSSEWHSPEAASLTVTSPWRGSSSSTSTVSYVPGAFRMIEVRVVMGMRFLPSGPVSGGAWVLAEEVEDQVGELAGPFHEQRVARSRAGEQLEACAGD